MDNANVYFRVLRSQEFRLAVLLPGRQNDPIKCKLVTVPNRSQADPYEALSYEWGDPKMTQNIVLDGEPFVIRQNLWSALVHLRLKQEERTLWIDAICINQDDTKERNHQVGLMKDIYGRASGVRVWLGEVGQNSSKAFSLLNKLWQTYNLVPGRLTQGSAKAWRALADLCHRTYWSRIWIVQEYVLAQKITLHCGLDSIEGVIFEPLLARIKNFCYARDTYSYDAQGDTDERIKNRSALGFFGINSLEPFKALNDVSMPKEISSSQRAIAGSPAFKSSDRRLQAAQLTESRKQPLLGLLRACEDSKSSDPRD